MVSFNCKDMGMACDFQASAATEAELMPKIAQHAGKSHNIQTIPQDMMDKVKQVIKAS